MKLLKTLIPALFLGLFSVKTQAQISKKIVNFSAEIDSNKIKQHVVYLASDKLQGRLPGTVGYQMAGDYVASQLQSFGLEPLGDNGTYFQNLVIRNTKLVANSVNGSFNLKNGEKIELNYGVNLSITPQPEKVNIDIAKAPIVFVGAGFDRPSFGLDDYKNLDCKNKIVLVYSSSPEKLPENVVRHLGYPSTLQKFAMSRGAIGVLVYNPNLKPAFFTSRAKSSISDGIRVTANKKGETRGSALHIGGGMLLYGAINTEVFNKIMEADGKNVAQIAKDVDAGKFVSFETNTTININYQNQFTDVNSFNVLAKMKGSSNKLNQEYIVHSAHLDHLGVGTPVKGDSIYNGAHDNASGTACTLEIARLYGKMDKKPARSIVFAFVAGEEMGLLGSQYFVNEPFTDKKNIVADVNMDMPTIIAPLESIAPLGAEHSSFWELATNAANALKLKIETDPDPTEGRFVRSDQYSFLKGGIPSLHVKYGYKFASPSLNLFEKVKTFRETHYHKVTDEVNDSFFWGAGRLYSRANFLISYQAANNKKRVKFNKGDFFAND